MLKLLFSPDLALGYQLADPYWLGFVVVLEIGFVVILGLDLSMPDY
jgi:hypothetical protein